MHALLLSRSSGPPPKLRRGGPHSELDTATVKATWRLNSLLVGEVHHEGTMLLTASDGLGRQRQLAEEGAAQHRTLALVRQLW